MSDKAPSRERDPAEQQTLATALDIAQGIVDDDASGTSAQFILASAFLILAGDIAAMLDAARKATHFCGWCSRANGESRTGLVPMSLDEVREHTLRCEHNPVVVACDAAQADAKALRAALRDALALVNDTSGGVIETVRIEALRLMAKEPA